MLAESLISLLALNLGMPASSAVSRADTFNAKVTLLTNTCSDSPKVSSGKSQVDTAEKRITVTLPGSPELKGKTFRGGRFRAKGSQNSAKFSLAGKFAGGNDIDAKLLIRYKKGEEDCSQTFKVQSQ